MCTSAAAADCEIAAAALSHHDACLLSFSRHLSSFAFCRANGPDSAGADLLLDETRPLEEEGPAAPSERGPATGGGRIEDDDGSATGGSGSGNPRFVRLRVREEIGASAIVMPLMSVAGPGPGPASFA